MRHSLLASYLLGLLLLSALVGAVVQMAEIERFIALARRFEPAWLAVCVTLQSATYLCESVAWNRILNRLGYAFDIRQLLPLSIGKFFSDQAMPSAGLSGNAFLLSALRTRGIAAAPAMACVLADLAAYFAAYASAVAFCVLALGARHELHPWLLALMALFAALQASIAILPWCMKRHGRRGAAAWLARYPRLRGRAATLQQGISRLPLRPLLLVQLVTLHACIILLDAATLWTILRALGESAPFIPVFASFVMASVVMSVSPVPLGLGTFEAACVAMLHGAGIGLEAGLAATLMLRGFTTWLPMLPGIWLIRREMAYRSTSL